MGPLETEEFDASDYPPEYVAVGVEDTMPAILERVEEALARSPNVVLIIPRGTFVFHTTHDLLALGKLQWKREVRVSIASPDPTIAGLARVLGFHIPDPLPDHPALAGDPSLGSTSLDGDVEKPTAPLSIGNAGITPEWVLSPAVPAYTSSSLSSTWLNQPADGAHNAERGSRNSDLYDAASHFPAPAAARPGMPPPRTRPRQTGQLVPAMLTDTSLPDLNVAAPGASVTQSGRIKARRVILAGEAYQNVRNVKYGGLSRPVRWGKVLAGVAILLLLSLAAGSAYAYVYLPEATVSVTARSETIPPLPVQISIVTSASAPTATSTGKEGGDTTPGNTISAPSLIASLVKTPVVEEGTRPASGTRQVPQGTAQGTMRFTNKTSSDVYVPAGVTFKAPNGVTAQITQGGTVRATNFVQQSFGTLDLPVAATVEGPDGNIPAGQLSGVYKGVLTYLNSAMQGGSMKTVKVVTQGDIDGLVGELRSKAEAAQAAALLSMVPSGSGQQIITSTMALTNTIFQADHKGGDDGETVRVVLTGTAQVYTYKESDLADSLRQTVSDWIPSNKPANAGPTLDVNSIRYTPLALQASGDGRVVYTTDVTARILYSVTPGLQTEIRQLVRGKDVKQATTLITEQYHEYINPPSVQARVLWFNIDKLPSDPARINIEPNNPGDYAPVQTPDQQITPDPRSTQR
ncbi:MAG: hypothetical protein IVW55_04720 [Chloroflexi bacterium]|nr:hypothetical protein [Chloroflexota bacterium]